eukprot:1121614-Rhodomonas_salina.2
MVHGEILLVVWALQSESALVKPSKQDDNPLRYPGSLETLSGVWPIGEKAGLILVVFLDPSSTILSASLDHRRQVRLDRSLVLLVLCVHVVQSQHKELMQGPAKQEEKGQETEETV